MCHARRQQSAGHHWIRRVKPATVCLQSCVGARQGGARACSGWAPRTGTARRAGAPVSASARSWQMRARPQSPCLRGAGPEQLVRTRARAVSSTPCVAGEQLDAHVLTACATRTSQANTTGDHRVRRRGGAPVAGKHTLGRPHAGHAGSSGLSGWVAGGWRAAPQGSTFQRQQRREAQRRPGPFELVHWRARSARSHAPGGMRAPAARSPCAGSWVRGLCSLAPGARAVAARPPRAAGYACGLRCRACGGRALAARLPRAVCCAARGVPYALPGRRLAALPGMHTHGLRRAELAGVLRHAGAPQRLHSCFVWARKLTSAGPRDGNSLSHCFQLQQCTVAVLRYTRRTMHR
jgi:hypothetical protein